LFACFLSLAKKQKEGIFYIRERDMRKVDFHIFDLQQHPKTSLRISIYRAWFSISAEDFTFNTVHFTYSGPNAAKATVIAHKEYSCT